MGIRDVDKAWMLNFKGVEVVVYKRSEDALGIFNRKIYTERFLFELQIFLEDNPIEEVGTECKVQTFYDYTSRHYKPYCFYQINEYTFIVNDLLGPLVYLVRTLNKGDKVILHILKAKQSFFDLLAEAIAKQYTVDMSRFMYTTSYVKLQSTKVAFDTMQNHGIYFYNSYARRLFTDFLLKWYGELVYPTSADSSSYHIYKVNDRYIITRDLQNMICFSFDSSKFTNVEVFLDWGIRGKCIGCRFPERNDTRHIVIDEPISVELPIWHLSILYSLFKRQVFLVSDLWRYFGLEFKDKYNLIVRPLAADGADNICKQVINSGYIETIDCKPYENNKTT